MQALPDIPPLQDEFTARWHLQPEARLRHTGLERLIIEQHFKNFQLWHEEDQARVPDATAEHITTVKRKIDHLNQQRNDLIEEIDRALLLALKDVESNSAELHSETPGMMID